MRKINNSEGIADRLKKGAKEVNGCWEWQKSKQSEGYGVLRLVVDGKSKLCYAHRTSYEQFVGPIPEGFVIDHLCRNRCCINPAHLEVVTFAENCLRGTGSPAKKARRNHCDKGHEYNPENTRMNGTVRMCLTCALAAKERSNTRRRERRKAARKDAGLLPRAGKAAL